MHIQMGIERFEELVKIRQGDYVEVGKMVDSAEKILVEICKDFRKVKDRETELRKDFTKVCELITQVDPRYDLAEISSIEAYTEKMVLRGAFLPKSETEPRG